MNKLSVAILFLFTAITLIVLAACQSNPPESAAETVTDSSAAASGDPAPEEPTAAPTPTATIEPTQAPTAVPIATATAVPTETPAPTAEPGVIRTYEIIPDKSEVRFKIDEVLLGNPKTVVGRTNQVTGNIVLDLQNPQAVEVGPIQVNARELTTDDSFRNRALRRQILDSSQDEFQFITFTPIAVEGISSSPTAVGEAQSFTLSGDLQIRDVVQSVTFEMVVTAVSETELSGFGEAIVLRSDYDLQIPSVPGVANVSDEVRLEIDFVAEAVDG